MIAPQTETVSGTDQDLIDSDRLLIASQSLENESKATSGNVATGKLFTPLMLSYIRKGIKIGQILQVHPYVWNEKQDVLEYVQTKWRLFLWYLNVFVTYAYSTFVLVRCGQTTQDETKTNGEKVYMQFIAAYFLVSSVLQSAAVFYGHDFPRFLKGYILFFQKFEENYMMNSSGDASSKPTMIWFCELMLIYIYNCINCFTVLMVIGLYFRPGSPEHLSSLVENSEELNLIQKIPFMIFIGYFELIYHGSCFAVIMIGYAFACPALVVINELGNTTSKLTSNLLRENPQKFRVYNAMNILVQYLTDMYGTFTLPCCKVLILIMIVVCAYGGIRMNGLVAFTLGFIGVFSLTFLIIMFSLLAEFHSRSSAVLAEWKAIVPKKIMGRGRCRSSIENVWHNKVLKSLTVLKVALRSYYYVDRNMVLTMIDGIVNETVNFFLTYS